ncbi:MAG: WS/DGAT domain-containing protein, partial [Dehalococcoidia bacterium]|nr:WS/DGAT domain-containing protein [Dehalococcoidia bacterium]
MYVIEGLDGDQTGIVSKVHHCMVDGVSGIELLLATVDITPEPAPPPEAPPWQPKRAPGVSGQLTGALWEQFRQQRELWRYGLDSILEPTARLRQAGDFLRALASTAPLLTQPAPRLPFSKAISAGRRVAFSEMSFVEIREIRSALGGTVNDVVLAILTGALRRYLSQHGYDPSGPEPRVAIPVNVRMQDESGSLGNRISVMLATLPIREAGPAGQLTAIQERLGQLKQDNQAGTVELLSRLTAMIPAPVQALAGAMPPFNTLINLICTNVPGPMIPLYTVGHRLLAHYPLVPLSMDMGLGVGVTSYNQMLYFGLMGDGKSVPDIERLGQLVDESFLALRAAAGVKPSDLPTFQGAPKYEPTLATQTATIRGAS